jgi:(1->4)-alpha-D-glucan 1-alpha-D-glucosylmutase
MLVVWRLLELRRAMVSLFREGSHLPVTAEGPQAENLCAFLRTHGDSSALVAVPRPIAPFTRWPDGWPVGESTWQGTTVVVPLAETARGLRNVFTGEPLPAGEAAGDGSELRLDLAGLLGAFPVGVWA